MELPALIRKRVRAEVERRATRVTFNAAALCARAGRVATQQLAFIRDAARRLVACCSRRAGKTHACAILLLQRALETPDSLCLYVTLTRLSGKRIVWKRLLKLNRQFGLGGQVDRSELTLTLPNGSEIRIMGCKDESEADKIRGIDPAPRLVVIDEAQAFKPYVQELVEDALEPMLIETKGTLVLIGTPGPVRAGYFYEACRSADGRLAAAMNVETSDGIAQWRVHYWTIEDNPFIDDVDDELAKLRNRKKWTESHPTYQREYQGRWVTEHDALVYKYDQQRNGYTQALPTGMRPREWRCVLVVDQGYHDADAIGRLWFRPGKAGVWLEEVHHERKASAGDLVTAAKSAWLPVKGQCIAAYWDEGGGGKKVAEDARRQGVPVEPAAKVDKIAGVELVNTALLSGGLLVPLNGHAASDAGKVVWDPKARGVKFSERYHTDMWDVVVYGMRKLVGLLPLDQAAEWPTLEQEIPAEEAERARRITGRFKEASRPWTGKLAG